MMVLVCKRWSPTYLAILVQLVVLDLVNGLAGLRLVGPVPWGEVIAGGGGCTVRKGVQQAGKQAQNHEEPHLDAAVRMGMGCSWKELVISSVEVLPLRCNDKMLGRKPRRYRNFPASNEW